MGKNMNMKKNKLGLISSISAALAFSSSLFAIEIQQDKNNINFSSLEKDSYIVTIISPSKKRLTFESNGSDFSLTPMQLGLKSFEEGRYKYEFSYVVSSNNLGSEVRKLDNPQITNEFKENFENKQDLVSGVFSIVGNSLVENKEEMTIKDFVINDDLIVDGSACIGFDCVDGESFGFDTIRLKENNLRIKFEDTSVAGSYPNNDWQLTANDSANGGANKFSIDDITGGRTPFTVEAGAPSHSLYVDDGGRIGNGTSTPSVEIHTVDGDTPTLRLQQDGSSGFQPQTWDVAGNETNFFVRDVTNGSALPFRIRPGAPTSAIDVASDGDIGIGTASPDGTLEIDSGSDNATILLTQSGTTAARWEIKNSQGTGRITWGILDSGVVPFKMESTANNNLFRVGQDGTGTVATDTVSIGSTTSTAELDVRGSISVDGSTVHPDFVFADDYKLKTIKERAEFMWREKHLPSLPKAPEGLKGSVDLVGHQMGVLEEVEVAHIYIQQLLKNIEELEVRLDKIENN